MERGVRPLLLRGGGGGRETRVGGHAPSPRGHTHRADGPRPRRRRAAAARPTRELGGGRCNRGVCVFSAPPGSRCSQGGFSVSTPPRVSVQLGLSQFVVGAGTAPVEIGVGSDASCPSWCNTPPPTHTGSWCNWERGGGGFSAGPLPPPPPPPPQFHVGFWFWCDLGGFLQCPSSVQGPGAKQWVSWCSEMGCCQLQTAGGTRGAPGGGR